MAQQCCRARAARAMMGKLVVQALVILMISAAEVLCVDAPDLVGLVQSGDTSALLQRVGHGESANVPNKNGNLPLVTAVQKNDLVAADYLLAYHANSSTLEPASGTTALTMAFSLAHVPLARMLMHYGGNPDVVDKTGNSARTLVKRNTQLKELVELWDVQGSAGFEDAPGTWTRHMAEEHESPYYHNDATGESRFMPPPSCAWEETLLDGHPIYVNSITHQSTYLVPKALAWKLLTDPETKEVYWFNYAVKTTSPTVPAELPLEMVEKLEEGAGIFWYNSVTDEASWEDPSLSTWRRVTNELGNIFWYHPHSLNSTWEQPVELAWRKVASDPSKGQDYFFNDRTGETTWETPKELAWEQSSQERTEL